MRKGSIVSCSSSLDSAEPHAGSHSEKQVISGRRPGWWMLAASVEVEEPDDLRAIRLALRALHPRRLQLAAPSPLH